MKEFIPALLFLLCVYGFVFYISPAEYYTEGDKQEMGLGTFLSPSDNVVSPSGIDYQEKIKSPAEGEYTVFEIAMYFLKAHESFRPYEYPDGKYPSKGFGLNLTPEHTQWATEKLGYPARSRDWTFTEAQMLLHEFWKEKHATLKSKRPDLKPHQLTALLLHKYNTGKIVNIAGCCGSKTQCGRKGEGRNAQIRTAHNKRRNFEQRLYANKVSNDEIEKYRRKAIQLEIKWKNHK